MDAGYLGIVSNRELGILGFEALGSIEPSTEEQQQRARMLRAQLDGFYVPTSQQVVASCIDGRRPVAGETNSPNAAGGSLALWVVALLGGYEVDLDDFLIALKVAGIEIGGHTDDHAHALATGCGANDKLPAIVRLLAQQSSLEWMVGVMGSLGILPRDGFTARLRHAACNLADSGRLGTPAKRLASLDKQGNLVELSGAHSELLVVINMVAATTLSRSRLADGLGQQAAIFNVDAWSFDGSVRQVQDALGHDGAERGFLVGALVSFNLATALVLCGPAMPVLARTQQG